MNLKKLTLALTPFAVLVYSPIALADGYINENGVIFVSSEDPDQSPWKGNPKCTPTQKPSAQKGVWQTQYFYSDGSQQTNEYLSNTKALKKDCEISINFPDDIVGSGVFETNFPNGKKRSRIEYKQGTYYGKLEFWFPNGLKEQESYVIDGISNGDYKIWHPNGQLALSMKYKNDQQDGMKQRWYETGEPWTYVRFENGQMIGELKQWFQNKKLERQGKYKDGVRHGIYKIWFNDGQPEAVLNYETGKITSAQCWTETGKELSSTQCKKRYADEE